MFPFSFSCTTVEVLEERELRGKGKGGKRTELGVWILVVVDWRLGG